MLESGSSAPVDTVWVMECADADRIVSMFYFKGKHYLPIFEESQGNSFSMA